MLLDHVGVDLAKGDDAPIIHVNADDVPAWIAAEAAFAFRQVGHHVLIDLIGYRRSGHNEVTSRSPSPRC